MKLKNKKTGGIDDFRIEASGLEWTGYTSLKEFCEDYEDYEEPKEYWYIECDGEVYTIERLIGYNTNKLKEIGNYFDTREEAEKAVRKLEAWKLLKDMCFKIEGIRYRNNKSYIEWSITQKVRDDHFNGEAFNDALHLLFGGKER